jgi:hypothetical protein
MASGDIVRVWKVQLTTKHGKEGSNVVNESVDEALDFLRILMETADTEDRDDYQITITTGTMGRKALDELGEFKGY